MDEPGFGTLQEILRKSPCSQKLGNLCKFSCKYCKKEFSSYGGLSKHAKASHHNKGGKISQRLTKSVVHQCQLCGKNLLCDYIYLCQHFKGAHNTTVKEYCRTNKISMRKRQTSLETVKEGKTIQTAFSDKIIGNLCIYNCHLCSSRYQTSSGIWTHLKNIHGLCFSEKQIVFNLAIQVVCHECLLCSKELLCEVKKIIKHLRHNHKIRSIEDYCKVTGCKIYVKHKDQSFKNANLPKASKFTTEIGNFCKWQCQLCSNIFPSRIDLNNHRQRKHDHDNVGSLDISLALLVRVNHQCFFCSKSFLCDTRYLQPHYKNSHGTEGLAYYTAEMAKYKRSKNIGHNDNPNKGSGSDDLEMSHSSNGKAASNSQDKDVQVQLIASPDDCKAKFTRQENWSIKDCRVLLHDIFNS